MIRRTQQVLRADPSRVIAKSYLPSEEINGDSTTRAGLLMARILALSEADVVAMLEQTLTAFRDRHDGFAALLERHYGLVAHLLGGATVSPARRLLIGAYFTNEYAIEGAALFNPSIVLAPDQTGMSDGRRKFIMSLRAVGEGHVSSIEFRTGSVDAESALTFDPVGRTLVTGERSPPGVLASSNYVTSFPRQSALSSRIIFPAGPHETHGMEDARFVQFVEADGTMTYYATYTAFDGYGILPQLIQTDDFVTFRIATLNGPAAQNKGMALFPRRIGGRYVMLSRRDRENLHIATSQDVREWMDVTELHRPSRPWELSQIGSCGSPIETPEGWIVLTHGVGPMRRYVLAALLLDLEEPTRVIGVLDTPLLEPEGAEREGYVPNVVYSCGAMLNGRDLVLPYGMSDGAVGIALVSVPELLAKLTSARSA
jgi:predicted GH43/DUF377 family glycosyl hydrolase